MEGRSRFFSADSSPCRSLDSRRLRSDDGSSARPNYSSRSSIPTSFDRLPRTREKLTDLPHFQVNGRNYSPSARSQGEIILDTLKNRKNYRDDYSTPINHTNRNSYCDSSKSDEGSWPRSQRMDGMRNRQHTFPRGMPSWMAENDPMADLTARMGPPNWPLGRRTGGGLFRERRGSGGSAMSGTSDESSYDPAANDKSSQGSGGSLGFEGVTHEIPIMIEADMPPSMMEKQPVEPEKKATDVKPNENEVVKPEAPVDVPSDSQRGGRCSSAPPQGAEKSHNSHAPQKRSATVPIHNNVPKPFDPNYGNAPSTMKEEPIQEESSHANAHADDGLKQGSPYDNNQTSFNQGQYDPNNSGAQQSHNEQSNSPYQGSPQNMYQNQNAPNQYYQQNYPQQQYPQQQYHPNQQYHQYPQQHPMRQDGYYPQQYYQERGADPRYNNQQFGPQPNSGQEYHPPAPVGFEDFNPPKQPGVIRNIPIFIEGQNDPIRNEDRIPPMSSSPRTQQSFMGPQRSQFYQQQQPQQPPHPQQPMYQQMPRKTQEVPMREPQAPLRKGQEIPIKVQKSHIPSQTPPRQASPAPTPAPPPVKLTPLQKIDQVRTNNEEFMKKVDDFKGKKEDRDYIYLDEMLTRALISLDDIDPDGNDEIRKARKCLIKDINSKISELDQKASAESSKQSDVSKSVEKSTEEPKISTENQTEESAPASTDANNKESGEKESSEKDAPAVELNKEDSSKSEEKSSEVEPTPLPEK